MYDNGKMRPAETIPAMGERKIKKNDGRGELNYDIFKNFGKCHHAPPAQQ
jgi:hypothetical protein